MDPDTTPQQRHAPERATALMMLPACLLAVLCLGAITIDGAVAHAAQRRLSIICAAAADDAAGMLDSHSIQTSGTVRLDPAGAIRVARGRLNQRQLPGRLLGPARITANQAAGTVDIELTVRVERFVFRQLPGGLNHLDLHVHTRGRIRK